MYVQLLACLVAYATVADAAAATFIKKCKEDDNKCVKESTAAAIPIFALGIPELGVKPLDPLYYEEIDATSKELKLMLKDIVIKGLQNCKAKKVERDVPISKMDIKLLCTVTLDGQYEMSGKLSVIPMEGKGKVHAVLKNVLIGVVADIKEKNGKDGKVHWDIVSWKYTHELKEKSELVLENLFEGNELLGKTARDLLANSPNEVIEEVASPILKALLSKVIKVADRFFREVPVDELVLN